MRIVVSDSTGNGIVCDHFPYRVKPCLGIINDNIESKVATFDNSESAKRFMEFLAKFVGAHSDAETKKRLAPEEATND